MAGGGTDDGADGGEEVGPPVGAEASGDFAVGSGGAEFAFGAVVVGGDFRMFEEGQKAVANFAVSFSQATTLCCFPAIDP